MITRKQIISEIMVGLCLLELIVLLSSPVRAASTGINAPVGTITKYNAASSASYRMYGTGIEVNVTNNASYPLKGQIKLRNGGDNVTEVRDLIPFFIKIPDTWAAGPDNSPFKPYVENTSLFVTNWTETNVKFNEEVTYADSARKTVVISLAHNYTTAEGNITAVGFYRWDMIFGVLLEYAWNITNIDNFALTGFIQLTLGETTLWKLETTGLNIPGFPIEFLFGVVGLCVLGLYLKMRKVHTLEGGL